jgi:uncharacterized protein YndB with AHSA1/START domain
MAARHAHHAGLPIGVELVIRREFEAPCEAVWKAWTDPTRLTLWWGPERFTSPECRIDLRVGGKYLFCMRSPEGEDYWSTGVYLDIVPMKRIVCTDSFADNEGNLVSASYYGMRDYWPLEMVVTVTFEGEDGKTVMTLRHDGIPRTMKGVCEAGWSGSFDKLAESLKQG